MSLKQKILKMERYKDAFVEVDALIEASKQEEKEKISENFRKFIKEKKSKDYKFEIDKNLSLSEQNLMQETKIILSLIYRSYFCTEEERRRLTIKDEEEKEKKERELREKYNTDNLFNKERKNVTVEPKEENKEIVIYDKNTNWFKNIINIIKEKFKKMFKK